MILDVDPGTGAVALLDPDVTTRLHVAVRGLGAGDLAGVDPAVRGAGAGRVDGAEVLLDVDWLRERVRAAAGAGSRETDFTTMVEYSTSRGWVEGETHPAFRVHCEWPAEPRFAVLDFTRTVHREMRVRVGYERYTAADLVSHGPDPAAAPVAGREAAIAAHGPGHRYDIRHLLVEDGMVAVHAHRSAGPSDIAVPVVDLYRVEQAMIVENWRIGDR